MPRFQVRVAYLKSPDFMAAPMIDSLKARWINLVSFIRVIREIRGALKNDSAPSAAIGRGQWFR